MPAAPRITWNNSSIIIAMVTFRGTRGLLQGQLEGFEQKYIFPAPLIDPIGKIAKEWHVS